MHEHEGVPILETLTQRLGIFIFIDKKRCKLVFFILN